MGSKPAAPRNFRDAADGPEGTGVAHSSAHAATRSLTMTPPKDRMISGSQMKSMAFPTAATKNNEARGPSVATPCKALTNSRLKLNLVAAHMSNRLFTSLIGAVTPLIASAIFGAVFLGAQVEHIANKS